MYKVDIKIMDEGDIGKSFILRNVFTKLHKSFVNHDPVYAVSFNKEMDQISVVSKDEQALTDLNVKRLMRNMSDYVWCSGIKPAKDVTFYRRVNLKGRGAAERRAKRRGKEYKHKLKEELQYVIVKSSSTQQIFSLFVEHCEDTGVYNKYGLCVKK